MKKEKEYDILSIFMVLILIIIFIIHTIYLIHDTYKEKNIKYDLVCKDINKTMTIINGSKIISNITYHCVDGYGLDWNYPSKDIMIQHAKVGKCNIKSERLDKPYIENTYEYITYTENYCTYIEVKK